MPLLQRRTLRSGKEFSAFDLAVGAAIEPAEFFDVEACLCNAADTDETAAIWQTPPFWINDQAGPSPSPQGGSGVARVTASALKAGSKRRKREKREIAAASAGVARAKSVAASHARESLKSSLRVELDAADLSHSKPAWIGLRSAEAEDGHGYGGREYTREEIEALTGAKDLKYVNWYGRLSIPIIDSKGRIIAVLGGMPKDTAGWRALTDRAAFLMATRAEGGSFSAEQTHHRRAAEPYPSISRGISHGGGQTEPGELHNNVSNTRVTDELLREECFQRLAGFANCLFMSFAPLLFAYYTAQMLLIATWRPTLRWNFARSVFAACTFNFGPHAITLPHLDFGNLSWGWCAITALGDFDPDVGGHLILWNLKLVIRFPPGSTILIPSAIIRHSNVPVGRHERRFSFTQYTAGGLFRWIRNGYKTDDAFEQSATAAEKAARRGDDAKRWEEGVAMYSTIESLSSAV
ncbi:hypothetical protein DFH06DRAFT_1325357 [Mycena polygramma]|nr:hypothetical protein DFH06DRAFT_1325357 [Mycena polygramma]